MLKRFLVFSGYVYYPGGGWGDFIRDFEHATEADDFAKTIASQKSKEHYGEAWAHVVDTEWPEDVKAAYIFSDGRLVQCSDAHS